MTRCYHECLCGKVHRFKREDLRWTTKCNQYDLVEEMGFLGRKNETPLWCNKPAVHVFAIGSNVYAFCEDHWPRFRIASGGIIELETLE